MGSLSESNLCRICAEESLMHSSFLFGDSSKELRRQMNFYLPVNIVEKSYMPRVVCQSCIEAFGNVVAFFETLNEGQIRLCSQIFGPKKKQIPWNGKKHSLFDKKYPSGIIRRKNTRKDDEDFSERQSFDDEEDILLENESMKLEEASMRFECLEPSCRLRFPNAEEIENHLKVENHSTMTLVVPSEMEEDSNRLDQLASHSAVQEIKDPCMKDFPLTTAPANIKKGRKSHELSLSLKNRIVGMTEAGMTATQIAKRIPIPRTTIVSIVKKYLASGNVDNKARSGRPRVWTDNDTDRLNFIIKLNKKANIFTIWKLFNESRERKMSRMTIRRKLQELKDSKKKRGGGQGVGISALNGTLEQSEPQIQQPEPPTHQEEHHHQQQPLSTTISLSSLAMNVPNLVLFQDQG